MTCHPKTRLDATVALEPHVEDRDRPALLELEADVVGDGAERRQRDGVVADDVAQVGRAPYDDAAAVVARTFLGNRSGGTSPSRPPWRRRTLGMHR